MADVKKYDSGVDVVLVTAVYSNDAKLISCFDPKDLATVKKNYLIKKQQGMSDGLELDAAIKEVCEKMKGTCQKSWVIFYYFLIKNWHVYA